MSDRILYVDDEPNVLAACKRSLGRTLDITTALSGAEGLELIRDHGPFAVVLSDMRMPQMDGIEFICEVRKRVPDTVCMMLTGNVDQETAMNAVNKGQIFRFLTKPCPSESLSAALTAGIRQYRLITAEKELLNKTLLGSIKALADVLGLVNPEAFTRSSRIKPIVKALVLELKPEQPWQYEIAAMLSQIGCVVLPPNTIDKIFLGKKLSANEEEMYASHPQNGSRLLDHIPRLGQCAKMIEHQLDRYDAPHDDNVAIALGSQIIHVAMAYDFHLSAGLGQKVALARLREETGEYNPELIDILERTSISALANDLNGAVEERPIWKLKVGMYADEDICTSSGTLLVPRGNEITKPLLERLRNFANGVGVKEPVRVLVPHDRMSSAA